MFFFLLDNCLLSIHCICKTETPTANVNQPDLFGQSLIGGLLDAPASVPSEMSAININSAEPDLFEDATFVSAPPHVEEGSGSQVEVRYSFFVLISESSVKKLIILNLYHSWNGLLYSALLVWWEDWQSFHGPTQTFGHVYAWERLLFTFFFKWLCFSSYQLVIDYIIYMNSTMSRKYFSHFRIKLKLFCIIKKIFSEVFAMIPI